MHGIARTRAAIREAGKTLAALRCGIPVVGARLRRHGGGVTITKETGGDALTRRLAIAAAGGSAAELIVYGNAEPDPEFDAFYKAVADVADPDLPRTALQAAVQRLRTNLPALLQIADVLLEAGNISGEDARRIAGGAWSPALQAEAEAVAAAIRDRERRHVQALTDRHRDYWAFHANA